MKLICTVAIALLWFAAVLPAAAQTSPPAGPPSVTVTGEGVVKVAPDQAWVRIGVESRSKVSKDAQQRNAELMTAVQHKLAALGIPKEAIKTVGVDLQLEFDYRDGKQTPRGYVARNTIEVRVDDFARVGDVLDAAVASGASMLHGLRFDVKDRAQLEKVALQHAVANASGKASAVAAGMNRAIDRVLSVEEIFVGSEPPVPMRMERMVASQSAPTTPVEAGEIEIRAQLRLTAAIK
jgi:uncharacterized protein YggE